MPLPSPYGRLLLPVYLPSFLLSVSQLALLILLPLYALELGLGAAFASTLVGLRGIGMLLFDVPAGILVARFGDKPVLLGGLGMIFIGNGLLALTSNPWMLSVAALILGAGFAAWMLGRQSYIADTCEPGEVGRAIALMAGLQRAGTFVGPAAGGVIAAAAGYPLTFAITANSAIVAALLVFAFTGNPARRAATEPSALSGFWDLIASHRKVFATAGLAALSLQLMRAARVLLVPLFGSAIGLSVAEIGAIYSLSAALDMSLFYPVGVIVDRRGRKWSAVPSLASFAVGLALLPLVSGFYSLLAVSLVLGLANGLGTGIVMIIGADYARRSGRRGQFLGLWRLIGDVGMSTAPLATGALVGVASLGAASVAAAGVGVIGLLIMLFFVTETR